MATYYIFKKNDGVSGSRGSSSMIPMINAIPALIYSVVIRQHFLPDIAGWQKFGICALIFLVYMVISFLPFVSLITNIVSTIMFVGMIWVLIDKIDSNVVRIVVKAITAGFVGLLELAIFADMTIKKK